MPTCASAGACCRQAQRDGQRRWAQRALRAPAPARRTRTRTDARPPAHIHPLLSRRNWLDAIVVISGFVEQFTAGLPAVSILRLTKAFRPLRSIQRIRGMRVLVQTILEAMPQICNVLIFLVFFLIIFGLFGVSFFAGVCPPAHLNRVAHPQPSPTLADPHRPSPTLTDPHRPSPTLADPHLPPIVVFHSPPHPIADGTAGTLRHTCHTFIDQEWVSTGDVCDAECHWDSDAMTLAGPCGSLGNGTLARGHLAKPGTW